MRRIAKSRVLASAVLPAVLAMGATAARADVIQPDLTAVGGDVARSLLGTGRRVTIGIVDTGIDATHPAIRGSVVAAKDFTGSGTTDDAIPGDGHGTGIAGLMVGHDAGGGYTGLAPSAALVNAKVVDMNENSISNGLLWTASKGAKIINVSVGIDTTSPDSQKLNLIADWIAEQYGVLVVSAAGNDGLNNYPLASAVAGAPNGQFNGIAVSATTGRRFNQVAGFSNYDTPQDTREKPELVAPGVANTLASANWEASDPYTTSSEGTSFSSPIVAGVAAQLMGYGKAHSLSTDPLILKAVLMASATHVLNGEGNAWSYQHATTQSDGLHIDRPLDDEQGAGQVNAVEAYDVYARKTDSSTKYANWKLSSLKEDRQYTLHLGKFKTGQEVDASLTWLRHVDRKGAGPDGLDASDVFTQSASLADFSLTLLRNGKRIVVSDNSDDNFEHLSLSLPSDGDYSLQVYRFAGSGEVNEEFGLATRVMAEVVSSRRHRNYATMTPAYGVLAASGSSSPLVVATPEPAGLAVVAVGAGMLLRRRRRGSR